MYVLVCIHVEHLRAINGNEQIESRNTKAVLHYMTCMNVLLYSFLLSFICSLTPIHMSLTYRYTPCLHICIVHCVDMEGDPTFLGLSTFNYLGVSWNDGTPPQKKKWSFLVGKSMVVGYHYFRTPPTCFLRRQCFPFFSPWRSMAEVKRSWPIWPCAPPSKATPNKPGFKSGHRCNKIRPLISWVRESE